MLVLESVSVWLPEVLDLVVLLGMIGLISILLSVFCKVTLSGRAGIEFLLFLYTDQPQTDAVMIATVPTIIPTHFQSIIAK